MTIRATSSRAAPPLPATSSRPAGATRFGPCASAHPECPAGGRRPATVLLTARLARGLRAAGLLIAVATPADAATIANLPWLGFRPVTAEGRLAPDECWDGKAGAPIDCALLEPMPARVRPKPRPPCLTPITPGCPERWAVGDRWPPVHLRTDQMAVKQTLPVPPLGPHQPPAPIPLPASGLLLLAALARLWRARRV